MFLAIILVASLSRISLQQAPSLAANAIEWQPTAECRANVSMFFDANTLQCSRCPEGMEPSDWASNECVCTKGRVLEQSGQRWRCVECESDLSVSWNGAHCVRCLDSAGKVRGRDNSTGKCARCSGAQQIAQLDWTGNQMRELVEKCINCAKGTAPSVDGTSECVPCGPEDCACKGNNTSCDSPSVEAYSIPLSGASSISSFPSDYIRRNLRPADWQCRSAGDRRACEQLANMCALQDYSRHAGGACIALDAARNAVEAQSGHQSAISLVPSLFYTNIEASVEIYRDGAIDAEFTLANGGSRLELFALAFGANGSLLGEWWPLQRGFLQLCPASRPDLASFLSFGRFFFQQCSLSLSELIRRSGEWGDGKQTMLYELYLRYADERGRKMLYQVPILNGDIRGDQYTGHFPNRVDQLRRESRVQFTKRFYVLDLQRGSQMGDNPSLLVRAPTHISLHFHLQNARENRIFVPYLRILHSQFVLPLNQSDNFADKLFIDAGPSSTVVVDTEFRVFYHVDSFSYDKTVEVLMATACSLCTLWAALKAYGWGRRSGKLVIDASTILKFVLFAAEGIGNVFLCVMGAAACWLTYAYKLQNQMFYVPLSEQQEGSFIGYVISATALKALSLAHTLLTLALVQTFFIDWERPKLTETGSKRNDGEKDKGVEGKVVIWRTYLVANEWNELQSYRKTQVGLHLLLLLFLLEYAEFGALAKIQPGFERDGQPLEIADTRMSRFAVDVSFYLVLAMAQWMIRVVVWERVADPFRNFMDLCSLANISVLALTHPLRGFYIHGRSVHGYADTDMLQMNTFLQRERDNLCALRGLETGSDLQTFVANLPRTFRDRLDKILALISHTPQQQQQGTMAGEADRSTVRVQRVAKAYAELNGFLRDFMNRVDPQCQYTVVDVRLIEQLLGMDLADTSAVGMMKRDPSEMEYSTVFLYGNEWALLSFELLLFSLVDLFWRSRLLAAFLTYLASKLVAQVAGLFFTQQLARGAQLDNRFLI